HYHEHARRPRDAYAFGLIDRWARLASVFPEAANAVASAPGLGAMAKRLGHIDPRRDIPRFAPETFVRWFRRRSHPPVSARRPVVLWPDTFNNHFSPRILRAATEVLEAAGCRVQIP